MHTRISMSVEKKVLKEFDERYVKKFSSRSQAIQNAMVDALSKDSVVLMEGNVSAMFLIVVDISKMNVLDDIEHISKMCKWDSIVKDQMYDRAREVMYIFTAKNVSEGTFINSWIETFKKTKGIMQVKTIIVEKGIIKVVE